VNSHLFLPKASFLLPAGHAHFRLGRAQSSHRTVGKSAKVQKTARQASEIEGYLSEITKYLFGMAFMSGCKKLQISN